MSNFGSYIDNETYKKKDNNYYLSHLKIFLITKERAKNLLTFKDPKNFTKQNAGFINGFKTLFNSILGMYHTTYGPEANIVQYPGHRGNYKPKISQHTIERIPKTPDYDKFVNLLDEFDAIIVRANLVTFLNPFKYKIISIKVLIRLLLISTEDQLIKLVNLLIDKNIIEEVDLFCMSDNNICSWEKLQFVINEFYDDKIEHKIHKSMLRMYYNDYTSILKGAHFVYNVHKHIHEGSISTTPNYNEYE